MGTISVFLALLLLTGVLGLPQISPNGDSTGDPSTSDIANPVGSSLVSPWSQWMGLKAPPIASALPKSKKKKLLPGPAPPEGIPEAPWVSWTRMKVSSALGPPSPASSPSASTLPNILPPPPPFPTTVFGSPSSSNDSSEEPAIYIQWTQMKVPLANPATGDPSAPETPWDAWTKMKTSMIALLPPSPPTVSKRMAPDRYNIASTASPRFATFSSWQLPLKQGPPTSSQAQSLQQASYFANPAFSPIPQGPVSTPGINAYFPQASLPSSHVAPYIVNPSPSISSSPSKSITQQVVPPVVSPAAFSTAKVAPSTILATILKPIPHQIVAEILANGTPTEITQVVQTLAALDDANVDATVLANLKVEQVLPPTLISKIPDVLTPLLSTQLDIPLSPSAALSEKPPKLSLLPEPVQMEIQTKATPVELASIKDILSKMEALPPSQQPSVAGLEVGSLLPPSLISKLSIAPLLKSKVTPPVLAKALPAPVLEVVMAVSTPQEIYALIDSIAMIEASPAVASSVPPKIISILPQSLVPKIPSQLAPLLMQPLVLESVEASKDISAPSPILAAALPHPVYSEIIAKASPEEIKDMIEAVALLDAAVPAVISPPIESVIPPTLITKLESIKPLLANPLILPTKSPLSAIPAPVLQTVLKVATPDEIPEIIEKLAVMKEATVPEEEKVVYSVLPPSVIAKLSPETLPLLASPLAMPSIIPSAAVSNGPVVPAAILPISIPPESKFAKVPPAVLSTIISGLASAPPPALKSILLEATPTELETIAETLTLLEAVPPEAKPLVDELELGAILPPSLVAKLSPTVLPLLSKPLSIPEVVKPMPAPPHPEAPIETAPYTVVKPLESTPPTAPSSVLSKILPVMASAPKPILPVILSVATPLELKELAETLTKLEEIPPEQIPLLPPVPVNAVLPPTLLPRLPPQIIPLLESPLIIPTEKVLPLPKLPATILSKLAPVLSAAPEPVLPAVLNVATVAELKEIAATITKLEEAPPQEKALLAGLELETILPPSLVEKIPPEVRPLLSTPVTLPLPSPTAAPPPPTSEPKPLTVLEAIPKPVLTAVLAAATPSELNELKETLERLEDVPEAEKPLLSKLQVISVLPPTLAQKLPPALTPLLVKELAIPKVSSPLPKEAAILSTIAPVLSEAPEPVLPTILGVATTEELKLLAETITKLEAASPAEKALISKLELETILPESLVAKIPSEIVPLLNTPVVLPQAAVIPAVEEMSKPVPEPKFPVDEEPVTPAEKKLLTKWAKIILTKTGKPTPAVPGEVPPLQAAWMEWVQLQMNKTAKIPKTPSKPISSEATTEYPWTKWLKLKTNEVAAPPPTSPVEIPALDVTTSSPEKEILDWLEKMENPSEPIPEINPVVEEKAAEILKQLGVEKVDLPPEQIAALLKEIEEAAPKTVLPETPEPIPPTFSVPLNPELVSSPFYPAIPSYQPFYPPTPYYPSFWLPSDEIAQPLPSAEAPETTEALPASLSPVPATINLTEYLIANKLIPPETPSTAAIPIATLAKILEEHVQTSSTDSPTALEVSVNNTEHQITASELAALTPTKLAALLKQILKDCNRTNDLIPRSLGGPPFPMFNKGAYYKNKYAGWKGKAGTRTWGSPVANKRALYPIPSEGVAQKPTSSTPAPTHSDFTAAEQPQQSLPVENLLPLPKVDTAGTVLDPAYWTAQKSMFLSKLFSMLAKVASNDSTTLSPKEQLVKQANTVLMSGMTRSVKHHSHHSPPPPPPPEDDYDDEGDDSENETEYEESNETEVENSNGETKKQSDFNDKEKEIVTNDNAEPNLPKEPENPLHKLFKFGVQKTVLSDLTTQPPQVQPYYIYVTPPPPPVYPAPPVVDAQQEMLDKLKTVYKGKSKASHKKKSKKKKKHHHRNKLQHSFQNSNKKIARFRSTTTVATPTTTENPVDFELLAKALLMDDNKGKRSSRK